MWKEGLGHVREEEGAGWDRIEGGGCVSVLWLHHVCILIFLTFRSRDQSNGRCIGQIKSRDTH